MQHKTLCVVLLCYDLFMKDTVAIDPVTIVTVTGTVTQSLASYQKYVEHAQ